MSELIRYLDSLGSRPAFGVTPDAAAVAALDAPVREALLARDVDALGRLAGGRHTMYCALFPVIPDEPGSEEAPSEESIPDEGDESGRGEETAH